MAVETPIALADEAAGILAALGALGCETRTRKFQPLHKALGTCEVRAYFNRLDTSNLARITQILTETGIMAKGSNPIVRRIVDPGWATMWQKRFEPFRVGKRLLIVPPWNRIATNGREEIVIQPGQAFGTGHHGSTRGILKLLEQLFEHRQFARALDVGTGSGILAFAMRKLGATKVTAIDCDAVALDNAFENAGLNHLDGNIRFSLAPLRSIRGRFDLIAANILSSVLIPMAPDLKRRLHPDGALVLAGILAREVNAVTAAYAPQLKLGRMVTERSWCALLLQR